MLARGYGEFRQWRSQDTEVAQAQELHAAEGSR